MKIKAENAIAFVDHLDALQVLQVPMNNKQPTGLELYKKLRRLELKTNRFNENVCNGTTDSLQEARFYTGVEKSLVKLGFDLEHVFVNGDPRGCALKVREEKVPSGMLKDWGGYGILAPEF